MGYSLKDLENGVKNINNALEEDSQRRARKLVSDVSSGRGFFGFFLLLPAMVLLFSSVVAVINVVFSVDNLAISAVIGWIVTFTWYNSNYTKSHPFKSSALIFFIFVIVGSMFLSKS